MWLELQIFGFRALWSPYFLTFIILLGLIYFLFTGPLRKKLFNNLPVTTLGEKSFFYSALILLYIVKGSPIDLLSHIMLTAHMTQMAILYFVIPIFLIRGIPEWMLNEVFKNKFIDKTFKVLMHPGPALLLFNGLFALYHIPLIFDFSKSGQLQHSLITTILFLLAVTMWWPIVAPLKESKNLNPLLKIAYMIGSMFIVSIACALIIFASNPMYNAYSSDGAWIQALSLCVPTDVLTGLQGTLSGAEMFSPLSTLEDQQLGGILMMTFQQIIYGTVIARIFFGWFSKKNLQTDPLPTSLPYSKGK